MQLEGQARASVRAMANRLRELGRLDDWVAGGIPPPTTRPAASTPTATRSAGPSVGTTPPWPSSTASAWSGWAGRRRSPS